MRATAMASLVGAALALSLTPALAAPAAPPTLNVPPAFTGLPAGVSLPDIAEKAVASVVNIRSTQAAPKMDPRMRRFFGPFGLGPMGPRGPMPHQPREGQGSGVVISADGLVLTNNHVIDKADALEVTLSDGRSLAAELVGADPKTDLAVIRISDAPADLVPMPMGDSDALRLGESVLAIGNPFGLGHTVTMGIVSAKSRAGMGIVDYEDFIQTDAAINPGNSGGALVNLRGELVGINTAILSRSGGYQGIGFAIPTAMARTVMDSLVRTGTVDRGWLGVGIQDLDRKLARGFGLPAGTDGVLITGVMPDTPAAEAGIRRGDVVVGIDEADIRSAGQLRNTVALAGAGEAIDLRLLRDGREISVGVTLGRLPDQPGAAVAPGARPRDETENTRLGLAVRPVPERLADQLDLQKGQSALMVAGVDPGSPAARAGLRPGDVVLEIDRRPIVSLREARAQLDRADRSVVLLVQRNGRAQYVALDAPAR